DGAQDGALVAEERVLASVGGPVGADDVGDVEGGTGGPAGDGSRARRTAPRATPRARLVARLDRVARGRHRTPRAEQPVYRRPHRGAPPGALRRGLARFRRRRLDGERELGTIRRRAHLALPAHDERASRPSAVVRKRETRYGDKEPARELRHSRPRTVSSSHRQTHAVERPVPAASYAGTGPPR